MSIVDVNLNIQREVGNVAGTTSQNHISILSSFFDKAQNQKKEIKRIMLETRESQSNLNDGTESLG